MAGQRIYPAAIPIAEADGNSIVLDLGYGNFVLYAHLQPGSLSLHVSARTAGTAAFDAAEEKGTPLALTPLAPALVVRDALPLDQLIVGFER